MVTVAKRDGAGLPASAIVAAAQGTERVEELMVRVRLPLGGLASAGDDDTRTVLRAAVAHGHGGGEVHEAGDGRQHAGAVVHEPDELADIRPAAEIEHTAQWRVMIAFRPGLHEEDASAKMIDHGLPSLGAPPFDGDVAFSARGDDPIGNVAADLLGNLRRPHPFQRMKMDVALEKQRRNADAEPMGEVLGEAVDRVVGRPVAFVQQRVVAFDDLALVVAQRSEMGVVKPKVIKGRPHVGEILPAMAEMQIAHCGSEQRDVAQGIPAAEDEFPPVLMGMRDERGPAAARSDDAPFTNAGARVKPGVQCAHVRKLHGDMRNASCDVVTSTFHF